MDSHWYQVLDSGWPGNGSGIATAETEIGLDTRGGGSEQRVRR